MTPIIIALTNWLHTLATIVFVGHFLLLAFIYLPALSTNYDGSGLAAISRRSRWWLYASLLVFAATGSYLTFLDPNYLGIGNFSNAWGLLMLAKHLIILAMIVMGFWYNATVRVGPAMVTGGQPAIARFARYANTMALSGVAALLLTALAQAQ